MKASSLAHYHARTILGGKYIIDDTHYRIIDSLRPLRRHRREPARQIANAPESRGGYEATLDDTGAASPRTIS